MKKLILFSFLFFFLTKGIGQNLLSLGKLKMGMDINELKLILNKDTLINNPILYKWEKEPNYKNEIHENIYKDINLIRVYVRNLKLKFL